MSTDDELSAKIEAALVRREEEQQARESERQIRKAQPRGLIDRARRYRKNYYTAFVEDLHAEYLAALEQYGMYVRAADEINGNPQEIQKYRVENPEFQELCDLAIARYKDRIIEAAHERAVDGWDVPIVGGRNRDEIITYEHKASDRLMELFLKRAPTGEFTDKQTVTLEGDVSIRQEMDLHSLSKRARRLLRELLEVINEDNARKALGQPELE